MRFRYLLAPVLFCGSFALVAPAQDQLLKQQEKLQAVAIQKVEKSISDALADAQKLQAAGSKVRAGERLRSAMLQLDDPILPKAKADAWRAQLNTAIRNIEDQKPVVREANPIKEADVAKVKAMI